MNQKEKVGSNRLFSFYPETEKALPLASNIAPVASISDRLGANGEAVLCRQRCAAVGFGLSRHAHFMFQFCRSVGWRVTFSPAGSVVASACGRGRHRRPATSPCSCVCFAAPAGRARILCSVGVRLGADGISLAPPTGQCWFSFRFPSRKLVFGCSRVRRVPAANRPENFSVEPLLFPSIGATIIKILAQYAAPNPITCGRRMGRCSRNLPISTTRFILLQMQ